MSIGSPQAIATTKVGRNDPCSCGSGQKFKRCCQVKDARVELPLGIGEVPQSRDALGKKLKALTLAAKEHWDAESWVDAIPLFAEITRLKPNSAEAHYDLGICLLRCGRLAKAADSLQRAVELQPGFHAALSQLAHALEQGGKEQEALHAYRKLGRTTDDPFERLYYSAKVAALEGKPDEAEGKLRRLLILKPRYEGPRVLLGKLLSEHGRFEEAASELTKAINTVPTAFEKLTAIRRMTEADRPLIERMRDLVDGAHLNLESRIAVQFGLGKTFNDLGDYAEAMRYYDAANALRANTTHLDRIGLVTRYDSIIARYSAESLDRAAQLRMRSTRRGDDVPVFIVGMPRSGTTLADQILSSHPAVAAAGELPFWKARLGDWQLRPAGSPDSDALIQAAEEYRTLMFAIDPQALRITNKEPKNFELLHLIRLAFPDARIIHCRRHPVDTCLSIFFSNFWAHQDYACNRGDLVFAYRQYERLMDHWRSVLPLDRFTEVDYEALVEDREAETRRLVDFIGLDWHEACLAPERNRHPVKTLSVWQARQPVYKTSVERWRRYEPWLGELRDLSPEG